MLYYENDIFFVCLCVVSLREQRTNLIHVLFFAGDRQSYNESFPLHTKCFFLRNDIQVTLKSE